MAGAVWAVMTAGPKAKASEGCVTDFRTVAAARAGLESQIANHRVQPPSKPYRVLKPGEYSLKEMAGGKSFDFKYTDSYNVVEHWRPKKALGQEITFTNSKGRPHTIQIVGSSLRPGLIDGVRDTVLKLPADVLESVTRIEVQSFVRNTSAQAYAIDSKIILHEEGSAVSTIRHEFGHSVARYIWGNMKPFKEWDRAFEADGSRYVTNYARQAAEGDKRVGLAEDFAEAVEGYLRDTEAFRKTNPNRAALLDTVFRNGGEAISDSPFARGGVWNPLQDHYNSKGFLVRRWAAENPGVAGLALITTAGSVSGAVVLYRECSKGQCDEEFLSPPPPARPPRKPSVNPN